MTDPAGARGAAGPREVFERFAHLVLDYDPDGFADLFAADGVMEFPFDPAGIPRQIHGREEIRALLVALRRRTQKSGVRATGGQVLAVHETRDPEVIVVEFEVHREVVATGSRFGKPYVQVWRVRDGEIVSLRNYWSDRQSGSGISGAAEAGSAGGRNAGARRAAQVGP